MEDMFMSNASLVAEREAKKEITKSVRDLVKFDITVPVGNPNYKLLHTNKFLTTTFPSDFPLENLEIIGMKMNSSDTRYSGYNKSNFYIEEITVTNDGDTAKIDIKLNPFASSLSSYRDNYEGYYRAYNDAKNNQENNTTSNTTSSKKQTLTVAQKKKKIKKALDDVGELMEKKRYKRYTFSDYKNFVKYGYGDCWAGAYFVACQLERRGVKARILNYKTSASNNHRSVQYKNEKGKWVNFPYDNYKINANFKAYSSKGRIIPNNCPK